MVGWAGPYSIGVSAPLAQSSRKVALVGGEGPHGGEHRPVALPAVPVPLLNGLDGDRLHPQGRQALDNVHQQGGRRPGRLDLTVGRQPLLREGLLGQELPSQWSSAWVERAVSQGTTSSATETLWFSR